MISHIRCKIIVSFLYNKPNKIWNYSIFLLIFICNENYFTSILTMPSDPRKDPPLTMALDHQNYFTSKTCYAILLLHFCSFLKTKHFKSFFWVLHELRYLLFLNQLLTNGWVKSKLSLNISPIINAIINNTINIILKLINH